MAITPEWAVDLEDDYNAQALRSVWGTRVNDSFADLGGIWQTYQPVVGGGLTPADTARYQGRWKRWADLAVVEQTWTVTTADSGSSATVTTSLPFDAAAAGIDAVSGHGYVFENSGDRYDLEPRWDGSDVVFHGPALTTSSAWAGNLLPWRGNGGFDGPLTVRFQLWVKLDQTVTATGGTFDHTLSYTPGATAPSEAHHEQINTNFAVPGTWETSTAQFVRNASGTALTVTNPRRDWIRIGDVLWWWFTWDGPVTGTDTGPWTADIPTGTMEASGLQHHGPAYGTADSGSQVYSTGRVGAHSSVTTSTRAAMFVTQRNTGSPSWSGLAVGGSTWAHSSARFRSGLLRCRLVTLADPDALLLETGDTLLLESGDRILMEA